MSVRSVITRLEQLGTLACGTITMIGFCIPVITVGSNTYYSSPYPPVMNGWQIIGTYSAGTIIAALSVLFAACVIGTSITTLREPEASPHNTMRRICVVVSLLVQLLFPVAVILPTIASSADAAAASPRVAYGPGMQLMLIGSVLSVILVIVSKSIQAVMRRFERSRDDHQSPKM